MNSRYLATVLLLAFSAVIGCGGTNATPDVTPTGVNSEVFFFLADGTPEATRNALWPAIHERLVRGATAGDVYHFISSGEVHEPFASVRIPPGVREVREHLKSMKRELAAPYNWFHESPSSESHQLNIPEVPSSVRSLRTTDYPCAVVLVGDPCYESSYHNAWSFRGQFVPTDDCAVSCESPKSPFNTGVADLPEGSTVTLLTTNAEQGADHIFRQAVSDFWTLFFQEHGGRLLRVTASSESALAYAEAGGTAKVTADLTGVQKMVQASARSVGTIVPVSSSAPAKPTAYKPVDGATEQLRDMANKAIEDKEHTSFFIRWTADDDSESYVDVDLSAVDRSTGEEVFFARPCMPHATLGTDIRHGQGKAGEGKFGSNYETLVVLNEAANDYWLNFYRGNGRIDVEVTQVRHGFVTRKTLSFNDIIGDQRLGRSRRNEHPAWHRLPLPFPDDSAGPAFDNTLESITPLLTPPELNWSALSDIDKMMSIGNSPPMR